MSRRYLFLMLLVPAFAKATETNDVAPRLRALEEGLSHVEAKVSRQMNELLWLQRLSDVAVVERVRFPGPPPRTTNKPAPPACSKEGVLSGLTLLPRHTRYLRKPPRDGF